MVCNSTIGRIQGLSRMVFGLLFLLMGCSATVLPKITAAEGREMVAAGAFLVDVRSPNEYSAGHVEGAANIPHTEIEQRLAEFGANKHRTIVLYCGSGRRAGLAQETLNAHGYLQVYNAGGMNEWK